MGFNRINMGNVDAVAAVCEDLASGSLDERLVALLAALTERHVLRISVVKTDHPMRAHSPAGRENDHFFYRAADITAVDGIDLATHPDADPVVEVGRYLMSLQGNARPARVMGPAAWLSALGDGDRRGFRDDDFATSIHVDHVHIGF